MNGKFQKLVVWGETQSQHIIEYFRFLGYFIPRNVKKVLSLKHGSKEFLHVQNQCEDINQFHEVSDNVFIILDGDI